jgi:type I restriction enzyme S subunit
MSLNMPKEWKMVTLNDICDKVTDGSHNPPKATETGLPMLSAKNIHDGIIDFQATHRLIPVDQFQTEDRRTSVTTGDILLTIVGALGRVAVVPNDFQKFTLQRSVAVLAAPQIDSNFFGLALKDSSFQSQIFDNAKGTAQKGIYLKKLRELTVMLPPLAEQKVIADKLDELLAQAESTKVRLDAIPAILKSFRQSVLAAAVSGKLTKEWRGEREVLNVFDNGAKQLTEFRLNKLSELPKSWQWLRFDNVAEIASNLQSPESDPNAYHIAPNHIESGTGKLLAYTTVSEDQVTSAKNRFYEGQILYSKIRPYLCKVTTVNFSGLCSADMYPVNAKGNTAYLYRWMLSSQFTDWASNAESRSVLPKINKKDLSQIPVPTPPQKEQAEIARRVEELFTFADKVEAQVNTAQLRVNNLTQSILAKAFRGELTAEWRAANPELICGENSAEALLKRIKAEREGLAVKKTSAKKTRVKKATT